DALENVCEAVGVARVDVVADDQFQPGADTADEFVELQREQASVRAQLEDVIGDLRRDPAHHFQPLHHRGDVAHRDQVLDLQGGQRAGDLVEAFLIAFEGGQGLVRAGQDGSGILQDVSLTTHVQGDDPHGLTHGDHRQAGLFRGAFGRAVPGARFAGLDAGVGDELHGSPYDPVVVL